MLSTHVTAFAETGNSEIKEAGKSESTSSGTLSDDTYKEYQQDVIDKIQTEGGIVWNIADTIGKDGIQSTISVPADGIYTFGIAYNSMEHEKSTIALSVKIDGANLLENTQALQLNKLFQDVGGVRTDGLGNEFAPVLDTTASDVSFLTEEIHEEYCKIRYCRITKTVRRERCKV